MRNEIFISHRKIDAPVAKLIKDFLVATGIPNDRIFCSSLPGNDVDERIDPEVKSHLQHSTINILILSDAYYDSAYCLNEAGVAWYTEEARVIPFGLPEIDQNSMKGFINSDYKLRRVDDDNDIAYLYDVAKMRTRTKKADYSVVTSARNKLKEEYHKYISSRESISVEDVSTIPIKSAQHQSVGMTNESWIMLLYAADYDGEIIVTKTFGGSEYQVGGRYNMNASQDPREIAKWDAAVQALVTEKYIYLNSNAKHDFIYKVTHEGYIHSDAFKEMHRLDTSKTPSEALAKLLVSYKQEEKEQDKNAQELNDYLFYDPYHK